MARKLLFLVLLVSTLVSMPSAIAQVVINELQAQGDLRDEDGDRTDWVEIYNPGPTSYDLGGHFLTDDNEAPFKWQLPDTLLWPGNHFLVFASGKDKATIDHWETAVFDYDNWRYLPATTAPPADWMLPTFNDAAWASGPGGIGYGDGDDLTVVATGLSSVFLRHTFNVADPAVLAKAIFHMDYDDGFVAYLNGIEIARSSNMVGSPVPYNYIPTGHEAQIYTGGVPDAWDLSAEMLAGIIVPGNNLLAVQVNNAGTTSSDLTARPFLSFGISSSTTYFGAPVSWVSGFPSAPHTNFKISDEGEKLFLFDNAGVLLDETAAVPLDFGHSYARKPSGSADWCIVGSPTPGVINPGGACADGYEPLPAVSVDAGSYTGSVSVVLSSSSPTAVIRYTLDGRFPEATDPIYSAPIFIDETTVLAAKSFSSGNKFPSPTEKRTYFIDEPDYELSLTSISLDPFHFYDIDSGMYMLGTGASWWYPYYGANFWEPWEKHATLEFFDKAGVRQLNQETAFEIHGGWSRAEPQKSFRLDSKKKYGGRFDYPLQPTKPAITSWNNFNLRSGGQTLADSKIKDAFFHRLGEQMHIDISAWEPTNVFINGDYWGIYAFREKMDEHYCEDNHGVPDETVDLLNPGGVLAGSDTAFNSMVNWSLVNSPTDPGFYDFIASMLDMESYIDYFILETYIQNEDWMGVNWGLNNTKIWQPNTAGGKWRYQFYDTDLTFTAGENQNWISRARAPASPNSHSNLFDRLLDNAQFSQEFINRYADMINTVFQPANADLILLGMSDELLIDMTRHIGRWSAPVNMAHWMAEVNAISSYNALRINGARSNIENQFSFVTDQVDVTLEVSPPGSGWIQISTIIPETLPWTGVYFEGNPVQLTAIPAPGVSFSHWVGNAVNGGSDDPNQSVTFDIGLDVTFEAVFNGTPVMPALEISEINYHSDDSRDAGDWIELHNYGSQAVDLSGYRLEGNFPERAFELPTGTVLPADGYLVLVQNSTAFSNVHSSAIVDFEINFELPNGGGWLTLYDRFDSEIVALQYDDEGVWPHGADGLGRTLELRTEGADPTSGTSWFAGCLDGSPGGPFVACTPTVLIDEVNYNSASWGNMEDWVELYNNGSSTVDVSSWELRDASDFHIYTFPAGISLTPGEYLLVARDPGALSAIHPDLPIDVQVLGPYIFNLDGGGDELRLFDAAGLLQFSMAYDDETPWPVDADGNGRTLELTDFSGGSGLGTGGGTGDFSDAASWMAGCPLGSPGKAFDPDCETTGISDPDILTFTLAPNPASDRVLISIADGSYQVEIIDQLGRILSLDNFAGNQFSLTRNALPAGTYLLRIRETGSGRMMTRTLVFY